MTIFSETLEKSRDYLETGSKVVVTVEATMEADQLKLLAKSIGPIDAVVADAGGSALRIFVEDSATVPLIASVLDQAVRTTKSGGKGPVSLCLTDPALPGEVDVALGQDFPINPQIKGALKSIDGVAEVEEV